MIFPQFNELGLPEILCLFAAAGILLLIIGYCVNILPLVFYKKKNAENHLPPVSIIICAKNEDDNLTEFLPKICSQNYPEYEVIVVNDCSFDNTENVIVEFSRIFDNLKKVTIKEDDYYKHGKKFALLVGIKGAKYENLLLTDADCYPASENWLKEMASCFTEKKEIVLGYGAYEKHTGLLNKLIRFDAFMIAVQYLSAAIKHKPYMGVGRNLAYTKDLFFRSKGFSNHYHIQSGDDDLFINNVASGLNTQVCVDKEAITYSKPKKNYRDWTIQKARHLSTAPLYKSSSKSRIAFSYFTQYYFYLSLLGLCLSINTILIAPILLTLKVIIHWIMLNKATKKLNESDLLWGSVFFEPVLLILYPAFHLRKLFYKPGKWTN
ncbi:MAG: glycosyltransferase [Sphingobacteriaceae bacterium]|nr:glycosyltransferase [Sphingobacteriaceae bacterium]